MYESEQKEETTSAVSEVKLIDAVKCAIFSCRGSGKSINHKRHGRPRSMALLFHVVMVWLNKM